jgi:hypothetical protein
MQQMYGHQFVNHRLDFVNPEDPAVHTQSIEATWGALKSSLHHLRGTNPDLLPTLFIQLYVSTIPF